MVLKIILLRLDINKKYTESIKYHRIITEFKKKPEMCSIFTMESINFYNWRFIMKIFLFFILSFFSFSCKDYDFKNIKVYNIYNDKVFHYLEEDELKDVDINTFEILSGRLSSCEYASYAKDKSHVYFRNMLIKDVDVETFEIIDSNYSKDKNHIYFRGEVLKKANVKLK